MYEQEKERAIHLMILLCNTIFIVALTCASVFLKWETGAVVLLFLGIAAGWVMHITGRIPEAIRLWMYIILTMLAFFFYGIHEIEIDNMAPVMVVFILVYTATEERSFVRLCAATYYLTMCYDFIFLLGNPLKLPGDTLARLLFHFGLVFVAERLAETMLQRRRKEREKADERISRLEETNRRAEDFLANVSHELRTPINAVTGITAVMLKNEEDPEKKKDIFSIQMAGNRLFGQIEDILDYTEIDTGRVIVSEETYMIPSLVNDIISENRLLRKEKELELIFDIDAGIPAALLGDGRKIKKIIKHLIDNAVKFTKEGGVYVRIYALRKSYGINLCIKVCDTGVGIAEEELGKITEKFFQSNGGRNRKAGGLGLGLSIVYGMVTAMDGFIQLESTEGSGTIVSVSIPQKIVDDTPAMEVPGGAELCIGLYLRPEKYKIPAVRDYYNTTVTHMIQGLDLMLHRVFELEELKKLVALYHLTHLVIGKEEYEEGASYFEELDKGTEVIVVADNRFRPAKNSRVTFVEKPFYCLPIVNILNSKASSETDGFEPENMLCPGVRVLVVDDESMNLMVAEGIFKAYQMEVKTVGSGMEAVEICEKEDFDLIFLDHMMPEMDGVETLKRLRKNQTEKEKALTVIAFTANAVSGAREMFLREGFDEFLSKPIEELELKRLLRKLLPKSAIVYAEENDRKEETVKERREKTEQTEARQTGEQGELSENDPEKAKIARLEEKGFHTESGLQYCRNDREFYEKLLVQFAENAERKITDIEAFFQEKDIKNYQIMVHALKSSAKMIGADTLSEMAKAAEEAAKNRDEAYIRENHGTLIGRYRETVRHISDALSPAGTLAEEASAENTPADGPEVSKEELLGNLSELKKSLDTFEANTAENLLSEMSGHVYQGMPVGEILRDIRQDVENFELGAASGKVKLLIDNMEGGEA